MATSISRRWLLAALFLFFAMPLSALAQTAEIVVTPTAPATATAGQSLSGAGVEFTNNTGGTLNDVEIQFGALPSGVTWDSSSCVGAAYDVTNLETSGVVTIATIGDTATESLVCDLAVAADVVDASSFTLTAFWTSDSAINGESALITVERHTNFTLSVACTPDSIIAGSGDGNIQCTVDLGQTGPSDASGVEVGLTLPSGVTVFSSDTSLAPGTSFSSPTWTVGDAAVGYSATLGLTLTADNTATGDLTIEGAVSANETIDNGPVTASDVVASESAAAAPTSFDTTIGFTNGYDGTVSVTLTCNSGTPLVQTFDISPTLPVNFVIQQLDFVDPNVNCQVTLDAIDAGYVGTSFTANSVVTDGACLFSASDAPFDPTTARANTCEILAEPVTSTFEVSKRWLFEGSNDGSGIDQSATIHIYCLNAALNTGSVFSTVSWYVYPNGDDDFSYDFYPSPNGNTTCAADESGLGSEVESDQGCSGGTDFEVGDGAKGCTITNTVFFEGIPTLSQYGLAILAVLTLGIGLVGFRRFV